MAKLKKGKSKIIILGIVLIAMAIILSNQKQSRLGE